MLIRITNLLNRPLKAAEVELYNVKTKERKPKIRKTDLDGLVNFRTEKNNRYLARIHADNTIFEKIVQDSGKLINIKLSIFFGFIKRKKLMSDNKFCSYCKFEYDDILDIFTCGYCNYKHCSSHRLPENHSCSGLPKKPMGRFREVYAGKKIYIESD